MRRTRQVQLSAVLLPLLTIGACATVGCARRPAPPPPAVTVEAVYPGANAQVVADTIAAPIEEQVNGVEKMLYMSSQSTNDGTYTLTVTFAPGTDLNTAQVLVQNRVSLALPVVPAVVQQQGVTVRKGSPGVLLLVSVFSPDDSLDLLFLGRYAHVQLKDELARLEGVARVAAVGDADLSVRIALDPDKLAAHNLTATDVIKALEEQHATGQAGAQRGGDDILVPLMNTDPSVTPEKLGDLVLKNTPAGTGVRLKDVARFEVASTREPGQARLNGKPVVMLAIYPLRDASPQKVSAAVRDKLARLHEKSPKGVDFNVAFDFTPNWEAPGKSSTPDYLLLDLQLPDAASPERTQKVLDHCADLLKKMDGVQDVLTLSEDPFGAFQHRPRILVRLAPSEQRRVTRADLVKTIRAQLAEVKEAVVRVCDLSGPGCFPRCGYPLDLAVHGPEADRVRAFGEKLQQRMQASAKLTDAGVGPGVRPVPQVYVDIDRTKAKELGVALADVFTTLQTFYGSAHVNDFNQFGRTWQVTLAGGADKRIEDLKTLKVRNSKGDMVPLGAIVSVREVSGPEVVQRLDLYPMVEITANPAAGVTLAEARTLCETLAEEVRKEMDLPGKYGLTWLEMPAGK